MSPKRAVRLSVLHRRLHNVLHSCPMKDPLVNPLIVQSDRSILLETDGPLFENARDVVASFAELVKSPEHIHTYRITPLSLWNAAAAGMTPTGVNQRGRAVTPGGQPTGSVIA